MKLEQVNALPAHGDLEDAVQLPQARPDGHEQAAPDHRADLEQPDLQLEGGAGVSMVGIRRFIRQSKPCRAATA
jgi:hypothetical protein